VLIYWLNIFLLCLFLFINWQYADKHGYLSIDENEKPLISKAIKQRIIIAQALYAVGALLSFINTYLSISFIILIQLNYALAPFSKNIQKK